MSRSPTQLAVVTLLCGLLAQAATAEIHVWTDADGVVHFSDTPPPPPDPREAAGPLPLDEDTPIPGTLNELGAPAASSAATGASPRTSDVPAAADGIAPSLPAEALDELDPVWFRGSAADATATYVDEYGPFTIGEPIEDTRIPPEVSCRAARRDLAVLEQSWPVYRDQGGRLRYLWDRDPYRGVRRYLDDEGRSRAVAAARQTLARDCAAPDDAAAQAAARTELLRAALCEAERAELRALESLGGDSADAALTRKRSLAAQVCGEPDPAQTAAETPAPEPVPSG
jgi:hypothetical protein